MFDKASNIFICGLKLTIYQNYNEFNFEHTINFADKVRGGSHTRLSKVL